MRQIVDMFTKMNKAYIFLYILPLSLVFCASLCQLYNRQNLIFSMLLQTRALSILLCSFVGYWLSRHNHSGSLAKPAFLFSFYCLFTCVIVLLLNDFFAACITIMFWPITLWISEKGQFSEETYKASSLIIALVCNYMAFVTIVSKADVSLMMSLEKDQSVGAANSIYLVLSMFPFIFLVSNNILRICLLIIPVIAFFVADKTTCLLAVLGSICYYFLDNLRKSKNKLSIILGAMFVFVAINYFSEGVIDFANIWKDVNSDVDSGGNGRLNIAGKIMYLFEYKSLFGQIVGSGYFSVARDIHLSAHNDFLEILYDYGLIGLSLFVFFWISLIKYRNTLPYGSNLYRVYIISLLVYLCACIGSNFIVQQINMLFFALLWGTIDKYPIEEDIEDITEEL